MRRLISTLLAASMLVGVIALPAAADEATDSITDTVVASRSFDILEQLVITAGLAGALDDGVDNVTVFAPTDRAFRSLVFEYLRSNGTRWWSAYKTAYRSSEATIAKTIIDVAGDNLGAVLGYHVYAGGAVDAATAVTLNTKIEMFNGDDVKIRGFRGRYVRLKDELGRKSWVVKTDIEASNGIIHAINRVILPFGL